MEPLMMLIDSLSELRDQLSNGANNELLEQVDKTLLRSLKELDKYYVINQN